MNDLERFFSGINVKEYGDRRYSTCKIPTNKKLSTITFQGKRLKEYVVAFIIEYGYFPRQEVSHRCHRRRCIEPRHLLDEPAKINLSRNRCKKKFKKMAKSWPRKRGKYKSCDTLTLEDCEHRPFRFYKVGLL